MARAPQPGYYEQRTTPRGGAIANARPVDVGSGLSSIGQSLANAGRTVQNAAQTEVEIENINRRREEDDARVYVAQTMAQVRQQAGQARRDAFTNAQDGWRGATETVGTQYHEISSAAIEGAPTDAARFFMTQALGVYQSELLDSTAEEEQTARQNWRSDTVRTSIDTNSSVLAADPSQYDAVRAENVELIGTMTDLTADQRRDLISHAEEQFAVSAVSGLVERNPRAALAMLRDPEAEGAVSHLSGTQRNALENRAQAELNRRESEARARASEARASLRDAVSAQTQLLSRGIMPQQPINPEQISALLGPDVAQAYIANLAGASAQVSMSGMSSAQVAQVAAGNPNASGSDVGNIITQEAQRAAQQVLTQRHEDPGGYALRNGQMRHGDLIPTLQATMQAPPGVANWQAFDAMLADRGADAVELRRAGVTDRVAPLSTGEASSLSAWLSQQSAQNRLAFFSRAQAAMNPQAYTAMMTQIAPDGAGAVTAYAGFIYSQNTGRSSANGPAIARTMLDGVEALNGGAPNQERRGASPLVDMPSEDDMRREWTNRVGNAYEGRPQAEEQAFQAFRAYYAGLSRTEGASDGLNSDRASRSINVATGGTVDWNGRETIVPWGMSRPQFETGVRQGFQRWSFLRDADPKDYDLRPVGQGRYAVYEGEAPLRNPLSGLPVEIEVRR